MPTDFVHLPDAPLPLPLLITGVSGIPGYSAFFYFRRRGAGKVVGIRPTATFRLTGPGIVPLDTEDEGALDRLFREHRFRAVLDTTGNCALKPCELDPELSRRANVQSAIHIARVARRHGARLVHLSSDLVYSGCGTGVYVETDPVDPVTVYGKCMAEAELAVAAIDPTAALLRIPLPMGPSFNRHAGAIDWISYRFRNGRPATLYFDEVRSVPYCDDMNRVFAHFLAHDIGGLFHLGAPRPVTLYQIGQIVNRVGGYSPALLRGCPRVEAGPMPPRAGDVSMDSSKLHALLGGDPFRPWPFDAALVPTDRAWHHERASWSGSAALVAERLYQSGEGESVVDEILDSLRQESLVPMRTHG